MTAVKAVRVHAFGPAENLRWEELAAPSAKADEVLVRVHAAGVNPVDWKLRSGHARALFPESLLPLVPGADIAGVVEAAGSAAGGFAPGDAVFGMVGLFGAYAELVAVKAAHLARMPRTMSFVEAASVPLAALTATQALFGAAGLQPQQRVLIHAAAGGVGGMAVQLAAHRGAQVTGTASAANADYLRSLGAQDFIDYRRTPLEAMPAGFDVVLDLVGGDTAARSMALLKPGGIVVVVAGRPAPQAPDALGRRLAGILVQPDGAALASLAAAIEQGRLRSEICAVFPLQAAAEAHRLGEQGHVRGKIVLQVQP